MLAFYGFLSIFPLLLLLVTVLGFAGGGTHSLAHRIESTAFSYFPVVGSNLSSNIHALHERSVVALVVGLLFVLWGSQGALQTAQHVQAEVWNVPGAIRPNFWARLGRTGMHDRGPVRVLRGDDVAGRARHDRPSRRLGRHGRGDPLAPLEYRRLRASASAAHAAPDRLEDLWPGALVGGVGWTVLQYAGGLLVAHSLQHASRLYGNFAVVLGLLAFLYLSAEVTVYAARSTS